MKPDPWYYRAVTYEERREAYLAGRLPVAPRGLPRRRDERWDRPDTVYTPPRVPWWVECYRPGDEHIGRGRTDPATVAERARRLAQDSPWDGHTEPRPDEIGDLPF